jgi:hypothetical protein
VNPTTPEPGEARSPAADIERHRDPAAAPIDRPPTSRTEPGERPPAAASGPVEPGRTLLDRPPGERYAGARTSSAGDRIVWPPLAVAIGGVLAYTLLGGLLSVTAGLVVAAAFLGWLLGKLIVGPPRAALVALATVVIGLVGVWLFGRLEGGDLDPIAYLDAVQGWPLVALQLLAGGGLAAASSR